MSIANDFYGCKNVSQSFSKIRVSIATPEIIRAMSCGEVVKPETINYRTFKPEKGGLFCAQIFGPVKNYECLCGKFKRVRYRSVVCDKCGVEVTSSRVRRERMGHIELASPVAHIWFLKSLPSRISLLLDLPLKSVERILYFESYVVVDPGVTNLLPGTLLTEQQYNAAVRDHGVGSFKAMMGAEAIQEMLASLNLEAMRDELKRNLEEVTSEVKRKKIVKRLRLVACFIQSGNKPESMIINVLPVPPPDIRPLVILEGGRFATSDINELLRKVLNRNCRLQHLLALKAPDIIIYNEKRMLQEAVDALIDNGRRGRAMKGANKRPYKSLSDMLKGKQGRFRQNLLGKRVDYSGRSVIVVGPHLRLSQCGLPKKMAIELFKPFIYCKLEMYGIASTIKIAKRMVQNEVPEVWDILDEVIRGHPVLLNRAPTLHRLGIQAFEPILVEGKAIQLHPLVCGAFNADFDGDQMAVHVPLSLEAQAEAWLLVMSTNNVLGPSSGKPMIVPSKDIVLGVYYLTLAGKEREDNHKFVFTGLNEANYAYINGVIKLHTWIHSRVDGFDENGSPIFEIVKTTLGRLILYDKLPRNRHLPFSSVNRVLTSRDMTTLVDDVYRNCGQDKTVEFADELMGLGFKYATISSVSFGKNDMVTPESKKQHVAAAEEEVRKLSVQYQEGLITSNEKYNKVIDTWSRCSDRLAADMMDVLAGGENIDEMNSIYMMANSGARGSIAQIKQLSGMRGLMAKPSGEIIETPIVSNFREGLSVLEYFNSTHGARKGLADTALKTANSGYLTRRLVDVAQDCVVTEEDCNTTEGLIAKPVFESGRIIIPLSELVLGRVIAEGVFDPRDGSLLLAPGILIDEKKCNLIDSCGVEAIVIRSVLMCKTRDGGVCASCYGRDLATGERSLVGEAVGVIAAQSVGEPGTQLTMRTFHVGGAATSKVEVSSMIASFTGKVKFKNLTSVESRFSERIVVNHSAEIFIVDSNGFEHNQGKVSYGAKLFVVDGEEIKIAKKLAEWDPYSVPIISEVSGFASYKDLIDGVSINEVVDDSTGISSRVVVDWSHGNRSMKIKPAIAVVDSGGEIINLSRSVGAVYFLPVGATLNVYNGQEIRAGDVIARVSRESVKTRDITGGLPRIVELFEARKPKESAVLSDIDGRVEFGKDNYKSKRKVSVVSIEDSDEHADYLVSKNRYVTVAEGEFVNKGDMLVDGAIDPHDILRIQGVQALADYMVPEIQQVYRLQGVKIDNKHFEVILRQMLQKIEVVDPGDSTLIAGEHIDKEEVYSVNKQLCDQGKRRVVYVPLLLGITKASLQTRSFISSASFQETTKVLTESAIMGKIDHLRGLKENVIVGKLLPVGSGFFARKLRAKKAREEAPDSSNAKLVS